jgi:hypothetical protein
MSYKGSKLTRFNDMRRVSECSWKKVSLPVFFMHTTLHRQPEWDYGFHINVVCAYVMRYM